MVLGLKASVYLLLRTVCEPIILSVRMDQEFYRRHSMPDMKDDNNASKTLSAAARRSFFRRRQKHKRSGSKDGKDLLALDAISTDSLPFTEGQKPSIVIRRDAQILVLDIKPIPG